MNFPSERQNDRSAIRARQKAYLASLDAQVSQLNRKKALDDVQDGHFVRNLPATPDEMLNGVLLAPLPPVDGKRGESLRHKDGTSKASKEGAQPKPLINQEF